MGLFKPKVWIDDVDGWKVGVNAESVGYMTPDQAEELARMLATAANQARSLAGDHICVYEVGPRCLGCGKEWP